MHSIKIENSVHAILSAKTLQGCENIVLFIRDLGD
jgi:hypothetical protein